MGGQRDVLSARAQREPPAVQRRLLGYAALVPHLHPGHDPQIGRASGNGVPGGDPADHTVLIVSDDL